jgi:hypothetical protein
VCDVRTDRLERLTQVYRCEKGYKDYREFLKHPELDAVALFTPAPFHAAMATEAMNAGKHLISAVPAGMTVEELEKLIETVSAILGDEAVFQQTCTRCGKSFSCSTCNYVEMCATKNLPFTCVCPQCLRDRKQFEQYLVKF